MTKEQWVMEYALHLMKRLGEDILDQFHFDVAEVASEHMDVLTPQKAVDV